MALRVLHSFAAAYFYVVACLGFDMLARTITSLPGGCVLPAEDHQKISNVILQLHAPCDCLTALLLASLAPCLSGSCCWLLGLQQRCDLLQPACAPHTA